MPTNEDRIAVLERKVAALELRRMYDERKAEESTPTAQAFNLREINENMTILLGVIGSQGEDVRTVKDDVSTLKQDVSTLKQDVSTLKQDVSTLKQDVSSLKQDVSTLKQDVSSLKQDVSSLKQDVSSLKQDMSTLKQDVSSLKQDINQRFTSLEATLEQVLHILTTLPRDR